LGVTQEVLKRSLNVSSAQKRIETTILTICMSYLHKKIKRNTHEPFGLNKETLRKHTCPQNLHIYMKRTMK
jgi:hypothetical protein